ncbi:MAG: TRAP transporter small permease [Gammaproteobacteria bacterium HGW-Gammaproteobacteria-8]|nr:MAG: TRAP transporter small permease [Gammaproteobacteria bacterium HGW-Gammaproteobacteria-8]
MSQPESIERKPSGRIGHLLRRVEYGLLSALLLAVVGIGLVQIGMRNLADTSLPWADPAMRAAVLWIAMLAGVLAAGSAQHIRIDALLSHLPAAIRPWIDRVVLLATALICVALAVASIDIVRLEFEIGDLAFATVPRWAVLAIIPVGFGLMAFRFVYRALLPAVPQTAPGAEESR